MSLETAAIIATVVATTVGTSVSVYETQQAGKQQKAAADHKAKELQRQALIEQQQAGIELAAKDQRALMVLSSIRANAAASGVVPGEGSALETYTTSSEQAQLNDMYTKYAGNIQAQGDISQSQLTAYGGKTAQQAANITAIGDAFSGIGTAGKIVASNPKAFHLT